MKLLFSEKYLSKNTLNGEKMRFKCMFRFVQIFIFLFSFCFSSFIFSQTEVEGYIYYKNDIPAEIEFFAVSVQLKDSIKIQSNSVGFYKLNLFEGNYNFVIQDESDFLVVQQTIKANKQRLPDIKLKTNGISSVTINIEGPNSGSGVQRIEIADLQRIPVSGIERFLVVSQAGVNSSNELTSNYSVRGGNYDENLVYVNGFLINRPFLTRSGQQEGMSFINSALVQNVYFSSGGFQSQYGDKLSSVLDIYYKRPDSMRVSAMASLLGVETHFENVLGKHERWRFLLGARYRSNGYFLNSLPAKGNYNPVFWDAQMVLNNELNEFWTWENIFHISSNKFQFAPQSQKSDFGSYNEAYSFNIYFDGQEKTTFLTGTLGTALAYKTDTWKSKTFFTAFASRERESFDIQGQYFINELETDPSKEEFGDSIAVLGVGTFLNHARNRLNAKIFSIYNQSSFTFKQKEAQKKHSILFGGGFELQKFDDVLSEWRMIDSAGFSLPNDDSGSVDLFEVIKGKLNLQNPRGHVYVQDHFEWSKTKKNIRFQKIIKKNKIVVDTIFKLIQESRAYWELDYGARAVYTAYNNDFFISPRASISFRPAKYIYIDSVVKRRYVRYRFSTGFYHQPPLYREFRTFSGGLNPDVRSQKSLHFVLAQDYAFEMWKREMPFKITSELYYKHLWDINPYEIENVRTRYYAENLAKGYAYGFDMSLNGEFVPGLTSFFKFGLLRTREDLIEDSYKEFYNQKGETIILGISEDQVAVDSAIIKPGFVPRPTDQLLNIGLVFQDYLPGHEEFSANIGINFSSGLPYGPPDLTRYKDTLRLRSYFRVDIGFGYDFLVKKEPSARKKMFKQMEVCNLSLEVYNLLGINNVLSKQWIQDVSGKYYAIPNYLTQRRINLKLIVRF